ncbi:MAG TPA: zinc-binding dehydrogenase [Candidatus Binataceae bacterium]|jgi:NADPH:quinone reductase-like Zn-dependent oxidoreductase
MKVAPFHTTGEPEVLVFEDVPDPAQGPGQILLKAEAAVVNYVDIMRRRGDPLHEPTPLIQATIKELVGHVVAARLVLQLDHVLPLSEAATAHRLVEERKSTGRVVLRPW